MTEQEDELSSRERMLDKKEHEVNANRYAWTFSNGIPFIHAPDASDSRRMLNGSMIETMCGVHLELLWPSGPVARSGRRTDRSVS
jgi:hypothetical protein